MRIARVAAVATVLAASAAAARDDPLAGRVAGAPVDCISPAANAAPQIVDARTILYREGRRIWRTGPVDACPSLAPLTIVIVERYGAQLCRNERFRVLIPQTSIPSPFCRLDRFTPYDRPR